MCLPNTLGMFPESAGMSCVPQVGLVGPASVTFPAVASGEPVSVPDNLLQICKAKPVIFKGKYNSGTGRAGGWGLGEFAWSRPWADAWVSP